MKTTITFWALVVVCGLAAFESCAAGTPITKDELMAPGGELASVDDFGAFGQFGQSSVPSNSYDHIGSYWVPLNRLPSLDLSRDRPAAAIPPTVGVPQDRPVSADRDSEDNAVGASSFILIALGLGFLICLCWKMPRSPQADSIKAR